MARTVAGSLVAAWPPLTGRAVDPAAAGALQALKSAPQIFTGARSARAPRTPRAAAAPGGREGGIAYMYRLRPRVRVPLVVRWMPVGSRQFHIGRAFSQA